jgi:hypothetical protein
MILAGSTNGTTNLVGKDMRSLRKRCRSNVN